MVVMLVALEAATAVEAMTMTMMVLVVLFCCFRTINFRQKRTIKRRKVVVVAAVDVADAIESTNERMNKRWMENRERHSR